MGRISTCLTLLASLLSPAAVHAQEIRSRAAQAALFLLNRRLAG